MQADSNSLSDVVPIVTGGERGLGASFARHILAGGGKIVIADVLDDEGSQLAADLGPSARYVHLDVTDRAQWDTAIQLTLAEFGTLTGLVGTTPVSPPASSSSTSRSTTSALCSRSTSSVSYRPAGGHRTDARRRWRLDRQHLLGGRAAAMMGLALTAGNGVSKWGVRGLTKVAAAELGGDRIRVNSVHPGMTYTPMTAQIGIVQGEGNYPSTQMGRVGEADKIAGAVSYLLSRAASYVTGAEIAVDGGWTAGPSVKYVMNQ